MTRSSRTRRVGPSLATALLLIGLGGCAQTPDGPATSLGPTRLLLIGIDGLEWSVVSPLLREGRMPHLERLMRRGAYGRLETIAPAKSPVIWTTVVTGRPADEHGIVDFTWDGPDGRKRLFTSTQRRTKALWNILTDAGRRSFVVNWWNSFPVEPIDGVIVSQANTLEQIARRRMLKPSGLMRGVDGQVHPAARQDEMLQIAEEIDREMPAILDRIFGDIGEAIQPGDRANLDACAWSVRADESTRRIALRLAADRPRPDLLAVYIGTPDVVAHRFWRFHEPKSFEHPPPGSSIRLYGNVVTDAYAYADAIVGELVAAVPSDTTVIVLSDHGMHAQNTASRFDGAVDGRLERESGAHEDGPPGLFVAAGPGIRAADRSVSPPIIGDVIDVTPTILALLGLPVGRDMDGVVLDSVIDAAFLVAHPVSYVETHDTPEWLASRGGPPPEVPGTPERIEQLRSLGYIDGSTTEKENP